MSETSRQRVGDYELLDLIGTGAQGSIFKARCAVPDNPHVREGEVTALKRLTGDAKDEEKYFLRQAEILQRLQHANIVAYREIFVLNKGSFDESKCMVMEFLDGESLNVTLDGYPEGLSWSKAQKIFLQVLEGLIFADREGVVHRDIKPSNIFQCKDGTVKLVDFGIARQVESGEATTGGWKGSLDYMAPDFVVEKNFAGDAVSDIYSLGVTFFRALSGQLPFSALSANASFEFFARWSTNRETSYPLGEILLQKNYRKLKRCVQLLPGLHDFLLKALCPVRSGRFQSFQEMHDALSVIGYARVQGAFNTYELVDLLGQGGFGKVFLGRVVQTGEYVAIKQLLSAVNERRFAREAEMLRKFGHPNIVNYIELVQASDGNGPDLRSYLIMENLPGMPQWSLRNRLKMSNGGLEVTNGLHIFARYLLAMNHMHINGIIHRDIKPANLYAPEDDVANTKIFDFGIARESNSTLTQGSAPGTLDFMAPEFALQRDFKGSPSSDLYSIGLCLYETITGKPPFERLSQSKMPVEAAFYMRAQSKPMPAFDHPVFQQNPDLAEMMRKALHYNPRLRYRTCHAMLVDLVAILDRLAGKPCGLLDGVPAPENTPEPDRIAEYEQAQPDQVEEHQEESLDTLATAFTGRTPDLAAKRPTSHHSHSGGAEIPEADTSPTAKIKAPASGLRPEPVVYKGVTPLEELEPTQKDASRPRLPSAPSLPPRKSKAGPIAAAAVVLLGLAGGAYWYLGQRENPARELQQRLSTLVAAPAPADPSAAPLAEWSKAFATADAWVEKHPDASELAGLADELRARGRAWPKEAEAAFESALVAKDTAKAKALADAFAAAGEGKTLSFVGLNAKSHERRLANLREQLGALDVAAAPVPPEPVTPPVKPAVPPEPVTPPVTPPTPPEVAVKPEQMKPEVGPNVPPPDLEPGLQALRAASEPALAALGGAASPEDVHAALDRLAAAWVPAKGEVKTRALGADWWKERAEAVSLAIRRATARDGAENRAARLASARKLLDHEMLAEWLAPDLLTAMREEQKQRESICWVDVVNESGAAVTLKPGTGLALPVIELGPGEVQPLKLPAGTQEGTLLAASKDDPARVHSLVLKPVPGTGLRLRVPAFAAPRAIIRLAVRQPASGPAVKVAVKDAQGQVVPDDRLGDLADGEYTVSYTRADYTPLKQTLNLKAGTALDLPGPEESSWKPLPPLATLRSIPADPSAIPAEKLAEWSGTLESLALADASHQAEAKTLLERIKSRMRASAPAVTTRGNTAIDAWRDYYLQVGVFSGLSVVLRSEDRRATDRPEPPPPAAGTDPSSRRQDLWRQAAVPKLSRVEREALSAKFDELARAADSAGDPTLALDCRVDAEILRTRRRRQPARDLQEKSILLTKVRAHAMFAGPEGLSGGVGAHETLKDLLTFTRANGVLNKFDGLLACYATYYAWKPSLEEPEEDRRKFANDPQYQNNIAAMRKRNMEVTQQLAEILGKLDPASTQAVADTLRSDAECGSWLLAALPRVLPAGHPLYAAGKQWLKDNPVNRVDINATLDHVGLEAP